MGIESAAGPLGFLGGVLTNVSNERAVDATNAANAAEAEKNRAFQTYMSNTAYSRSMYDMKRAGLNPMLAMNPGGGASTPTGAKAQLQAPHFEDATSKGISSALDSRRVKKEIKAVDAQSGLNEAATATQHAQKVLNINNAKVAEQTSKRLKAELPAIKAETEVRTIHSGYDKTVAPLDALMRRLNPFGGGSRHRGSFGLPRSSGTIKIPTGAKPKFDRKNFSRKNKPKHRKKFKPR